ncbi:VOC family protein [Paenibacillus sp. J22TS3]|uniref:VOC family protein n=1 Tax=Paenibacillus sp. J22TS3 TaxID=2807192 RepID=UPI001B24B894|nr:ring-cleaving dioxygenase [Paenibacillus sp. J22TS3]GIP20696.1 hypothetical protein J22TS3_09710 [Paenibacillus sp. J22TS3]
MRMEELKLKTARLEQLKTFYSNVLELGITAQTERYFSVQVGDTLLTFEQAEPDEGEPFYHFAVNIPENQLAEAKQWLARKVNLSLSSGEDEADFPDWNANAIYFEDPAGNIGEFIARHNLGNASDKPFGPHSLLEISEIGIVREDVAGCVQDLNEKGFPHWREGNEGFRPLGDEHGLFIVVKQGRTWFFSDKQAEQHPVTVKVRGAGTLEL